MEKWLLVLFLFVNVAHWVEGTQVSRERFIVGCYDMIPNCAAYTHDVCMHSAWALQNCQQYCHLCGTGTRSVGHESLDMFHGISGCFYKNQMYQEGASWNDGCNYSCRCLDERSGLYHCKRTVS
ncbi:uncharacterized protein LOC132755181 isoform X2 [Ruditapes philippinarum]|uniref:uncharacterized protein LOC132755181 isoform X2 n=1 Tax=Ruditapes philippinarum TaxID=129788 RepID=UPI00295AC5B8|nr:uncharacterized protein LOC132755181 isoform X2 [Ruditapes philippinarum]